MGTRRKRYKWFSGKDAKGRPSYVLCESREGLAGALAIGLTAANAWTEEDRADVPALLRFRDVPEDEEGASKKAPKRLRTEYAAWIKVGMLWRRATITPNGLTLKGKA